MVDHMLPTKIDKFIYLFREWASTQLSAESNVEPNPTH